MKGGTALNLLVQDLPRLSVDIDIVYVPHATARDAALTEIGVELNQMRDRLEKHGISAEVAATTVGDETKLFARRGRDQVKIEINHVFRGAASRRNPAGRGKGVSNLGAGEDRIQIHSDSATIPATIPTAEIKRRRPLPSLRYRAPMSAPMTMLISRAGAM